MATKKISQTFIKKVERMHRPSGENFDDDVDLNIDIYYNKKEDKSP
jgi:hypothetical protein